MRAGEQKHNSSEQEPYPQAAIPSFFFKYATLQSWQGYSVATCVVGPYSAGMWNF